MNKCLTLIMVLLFLSIACEDKNTYSKPGSESALFKAYIEEVSGEKVFKKEGMVLLLSNFSCNSCNKIILKYLSQKVNNKKIISVFMGYNRTEFNQLVKQYDLKNFKVFFDSLNIASNKDLLLDYSIFFVKRKDGSAFFESIKPNQNISEVLEWIDTMAVQ